MATYDLLMLAILIGLTLYGYFKGMAWQVAYIASFVASAVLANKFAGQLAPQVSSVMGVQAPWNKFVAMAIIYAVSSFAIWMLFRVVSKMIDSVKMEGFDHQMGAFLGFGRGVLWCVGVTFLVLTVAPTPAAWKQHAVNSRSGYYIARLIDETESVFPPEVHQVIGPYLDQLGNELEGSQGYQPGTAAPPQNGVWPNAGGQAPAQSAAPVWNQSATTNNQPPSNSGINWPAPTQSAPAPANNNWPPTDSQASRQPAPPASNNDNIWPDPADSRPNNTPAQQVTWPWD